MRTLQQILEEMKELSKNERSVDEIHMEADALLCEALKLVGELELVEVYRSVEKWYE